MKLRLSIAAIATAAGVAASSAFLLPAANATTVTHTMKFTSLTQHEVTFSALAGGEVDKDVVKGGKVVGWDLVRITINPKTHQIAGGFTLMTKDGFLYGVLSPASGTSRGRLTGGSGDFTGARGTLVVKDLNKAGTTSAVTITWHD